MSRRAVGPLGPVLPALWAALAMAQPAQAQDDGARAYMLAPAGTKLASVHAIMIEANQSLAPGTVIPDADFEIDVGVFQFTQTFSIGGSQGAAFVAIPIGKVTGSVELPGQSISGKSSGLGDPTIGVAFGLIGTPSLPVEQYVRHEPGFTLGLLGKVLPPLGAYDSTKLVNLGANRFVYQVGAPMTYSIGASLTDPALTTFELLPTVTFFGGNDEPNGADHLGQKPMFGLEAHVTRNLGSTVWISADARYFNGGETETNGLDDGNPQEFLALGGSVNVAFNRRLSLKTTYGGIVARNDGGADGWMLRAILSLVL